MKTFLISNIYNFTLHPGKTPGDWHNRGKRSAEVQKYHKPMFIELMIVINRSLVSYFIFCLYKIKSM